MLTVTRESARRCRLDKDGETIGVAAVEGGEARCCIAPRWRRRGYGTFLWKKTLAALAVPPGERLTARAGPGEGAFWEKFGFAPAGEGLYVRERPDEVNALRVAHDFWRKHLRAGAFAVDATAGNGHDTALLCRLVGPSGRVLAMDIQQRAVDATNARLRALGLDGVGRCVRADHADIARHAPGGADAVVFNLGYLPGASHDVFTTPDTTLPALDAALALLRAGGILTVCAYSGGAQGTGERDAVVAWAHALREKEDFFVETALFEERTGFPPIAVCVRRTGAGAPCGRVGKMGRNTSHI